MTGFYQTPETIKINYSILLKKQLGIALKIQRITLNVPKNV